MNYNLADIQFPVYLLGKEKPQEDEGLLFYHRIDKEGNETKLIVDNKNWHHETLPQRRLKCLMMPDTQLAKITHTIFFLGDLVKLASPETWFIDNHGKIFTYTKSHRVLLLFKTISKVVRHEASCIIEVEGVEARFKCLYAPKEEKYAGVLKLGHGYILYGLYSEKPNDSWRMI